MVRGHNNKRPGASKAVSEARRQPKFKQFAKAKPNFIIDDRPSQRIKARKKAPAWIEVIKKGQFEKVPGTRIQKKGGGFPVRVVIADGKEFPPDKVAAAKKHIRILFQQEQEKLEVDRIINGKAATKVLPEPPRWLEKKDKKSSSKLTLSRKARKREEFMQRKDLREEKAKRDGREIVSDQFHFGEVVEAAPNCAMVRLLDPESIALLSTLRASVPAAGEAPLSVEEVHTQVPAAGEVPLSGEEVRNQAPAASEAPLSGEEVHNQAPSTLGGRLHSQTPASSGEPQAPSTLGGELHSQTTASSGEPQVPPDTGSNRCGQSLITGSQVSSPSGGDSHGQCSEAPASSSELHSQACTPGEVSSQVSSSLDLLRIGCADVVEAGLRLVPGVAVRFKLYKDKNGVGGCEAASRESASGLPFRKKRRRGHESGQPPAKNS